MESQRHNYGIIPSRSPEQTDEFNSLMKYCRELLTRGERKVHLAELDSQVFLPGALGSRSQRGIQGA